ncbi:MAG: hypothetical protein ACREKR_02460 [Candidatus Methylomirabilales bacterium]
MAESEILEYYSVLRTNRDIFLLNQPDAFGAHETIHRTFGRIGRLLATTRDQRGSSHISLIPFILLMQRQAVAAFWSLASHQSYQAWVALRPCVESALIIGKWIEEPDNARIWSEREHDRAAFKKAYEGKALISSRLPRASEIQGVLRTINDDFMHTNTRYYSRHVEAAPGGPDHINLLLHYFDRDEREHRAHVLAFLHLSVVMQDSLCAMFASVFPPGATINAGLSAFEELFKPKTTDLLNRAPAVLPVLDELGLWGLSPAV